MENLNGLSLPQNINLLKMVSKENDLKKSARQEMQKNNKNMFKQLIEDMDILHEKQRDEWTEEHSSVSKTEIELLKEI